jgi:hypothetical protein
MKMYGGVEILLLPFSISALDDGQWSSRPGRFTPWETAPGTHCIRGSVDSRAGLNAVENRKISCICWELNPIQPAP